MNQIVPIPCQGKKNVNLIPHQELLARKKLIFSTRGILARPHHAPTYPAKQCLVEKNAVD